MASRDQVIHLLEQHDFLSTKQIYHSLRDNFPLNRLVYQGLICCTSDGSKNLYFLPGKIDKLPEALRNRGQQAKEQAIPQEVKPESWDIDKLELSQEEKEKLLKAIKGEVTCHYTKAELELMEECNPEARRIYERNKYRNNPEFRKGRLKYYKGWYRERYAPALREAREQTFNSILENISRFLEQV
ncbi:hypothetical protein JW930_00270 [Candidatus Woesearchaeota archaeon]|nr:hypothetical protein [Candidatus Woesearchaeota archaeon]